MPLKPMSEKKRAKLAAQGVVFPTSTLRPVSAKKAAERKAAGKPVFARPVARYTGPDDDTVACVVERDRGRCGWCGHPIDFYGVRGFDWSVGHRRPRQMGGDTRPDTNLPSNLELLHGHGRSLCHGELETERRGEAGVLGHLLDGEAVPSQRPIRHAVHGWCYLTDDGAVTQAPPPVDLGDRFDFGGYWDDESGAVCA
jgi:hypothetical protein